MPEEKLPDIHLHLDASNELDRIAEHTGLDRRLLRKQAEIFAWIEAQSDKDFDGVVRPKHALLAAKKLPEIIADSTIKDAGIFLSYSTKDEDFARELEADLNGGGISSFLAPLSIKPGSAWQEEIWRGIRGCRVFVLVVTAEALKSKWCLLEIGAALGLKKQIIAVLRHSNKIPDVLKTIQAMKVQTKKQQADLVTHLKQLCSR